MNDIPPGATASRFLGRFLLWIGGGVAGLGAAVMLYFIWVGIANSEDGRYMVAVAIIGGIPLLLGGLLILASIPLRRRR